MMGTMTRVMVVIVMTVTVEKVMVVIVVAVTVRKEVMVVPMRVVMGIIAVIMTTAAVFPSTLSIWTAHAT